MFSVSRVSAHWPGTDRQTHPVLSAAHSSHTPTSTKSSTRQRRPSSQKSIMRANNTSRTLHVSNGLCPAVANASVPSGDIRDKQRTHRDAGTLPMQASHWMLWTSPTCETGSLTSDWSSSTSTQSTGSWLSCSYVSFCTTSTVETRRRVQEFAVQVYVFFLCKESV